MSKPNIFTFLGVPGSGKSYFARNLAKETGIIRLSSDAMRLAIFGSLEGIAKVYNSKGRETVNTYVFNALDYCVGQILDQSQDVIYDAHYNKLSDREILQRIASEHGARLILVSIKTPESIALKRGQEREATVDQRQLSEEAMREVMNRHRENTDCPTDSENVIEIDGTVPFEQQYISFNAQFAEIENE